jgi:hypothetical protein
LAVNGFQHGLDFTCRNHEAGCPQAFPRIQHYWLANTDFD